MRRRCSTLPGTSTSYARAHLKLDAPALARRAGLHRVSRPGQGQALESLRWSTTKVITRTARRKSRTSISGLTSRMNGGSGFYANNVNVWHSPYEFTLDFAVTEPPEAADPENPDAALTVPNSVVARIRIPVGLVFDVIRAINESMTQYEAIWGEIRAPKLREPEPEEGKE
jgi:uncharacterized protein DUF3467